MIGAAFEGVGDTKLIPLNAIKCDDGFTEGDQVQVAFTGESGLTELKIGSSCMTVGIRSRHNLI